MPLPGPLRAVEADRGVAEQDRLAAVIRDGNLAAILATFFGLGVLLSFTPCVLPMVPILSGIIVGSGEHQIARTGEARRIVDGWRGQVRSGMRAGERTTAGDPDR